MQRYTKNVKPLLIKLLYMFSKVQVKIRINTLKFIRIYYKDNSDFDISIVSKKKKKIMEKNQRSIENK